MSHVSQQANPQVSPQGRTYTDDTTTRTTDASLGTLVSQLSSQIPTLIRSEIRLAQAEVTEKGKRAGIGLGMFSVAGLLAFFGLGFLLTTAALLLDLMMPAWLAVLIVTGLGHRSLHHSTTVATSTVTPKATSSGGRTLPDAEPTFADAEPTVDCPVCLTCATLL